jgi:predicted solute-binding protein
VHVRTQQQTSDTPAGRRASGNWRHRENRASSKYIAKRVTEDDHELITAYANSLNVKVSDLLAPAVDELVSRAREHQQAKAS